MVQMPPGPVVPIQEHSCVPEIASSTCSSFQDASTSSHLPNISPLSSTQLPSNVHKDIAPVPTTSSIATDSSFTTNMPKDINSLPAYSSLPLSDAPPKQHKRVPQSGNQPPKQRKRVINLPASDNRTKLFASSLAKVGCFKTPKLKTSRCKQLPEGEFILKFANGMQIGDQRNFSGSFSSIGEPMVILQIKDDGKIPIPKLKVDVISLSSSDGDRISPVNPVNRSVDQFVAQPCSSGPPIDVPVENYTSKVIAWQEKNPHPAPPDTQDLPQISDVRSLRDDRDPLPAHFSQNVDAVSTDPVTISVCDSDNESDDCDLPDIDELMRDKTQTALTQLLPHSPSSSHSSSIKIVNVEECGKTSNPPKPKSNAASYSERDTITENPKEIMNSFTDIRTSCRMQRPVAVIKPQAQSQAHVLLQQPHSQVRPQPQSQVQHQPQHQPQPQSQLNRTSTRCDSSNSEEVRFLSEK